MGNKITLKGIQQNFFRVQMVLIISLALFLGIAGTLINIHFERQKRDQNLQNVAEAIAQSPILTEQQIDTIILTEYLKIQISQMRKEHTQRTVIGIFQIR